MLIQGLGCQNVAELVLLHLCCASLVLETQDKTGNKTGEKKKFKYIRIIFDVQMCIQLFEDNQI